MWTSVSWFSDQRTAQVDLRSGRGSAPEAGGLLPRRHVRVSREQRGSSVLLSHGGGMQDCKSNPFDDCRERSRLQGFKVKLFHCLQVLLSISSCAVPSIFAVDFKLRSAFNFCCRFQVAPLGHGRRGWRRAGVGVDRHSAHHWLWGGGDQPTLSATSSNCPQMLMCQLEKVLTGT